MVPILVQQQKIWEYYQGFHQCLAIIIFICVFNFHLDINVSHSSLCKRPSCCYKRYVPWAFFRWNKASNRLEWNRKLQYILELTIENITKYFRIKLKY